MQTNIRTDLFRVYEPVATQRSYDEIEFPKLQSPSFGFVEKVEENSEEKPSSTQTSLVVPDPRTQTSTNSPYKSTIIVDKKTQNMEYYDDQGNLKFKSRISTGKNSGQKQKVGDMRTPEGTFTISGFENRTDKYARDNFGKQPWVYRLNTPGWTGILFHGDANEPDKIGTPASKGCIRLPNDKLEELHNILGEDNNALNKLKVIIKKQGGNMRLVSKNPVQRFKQGKQILYARDGDIFQNVTFTPDYKRGKRKNYNNWNKSFNERSTSDDKYKKYNEALDALAREEGYNMSTAKGRQSALLAFADKNGLINREKFSKNFADGYWGTESDNMDLDIANKYMDSLNTPATTPAPATTPKYTPYQQAVVDYNTAGKFLGNKGAVRGLNFRNYNEMENFVRENPNHIFSRLMTTLYGTDTNLWNRANIEGDIRIGGNYGRRDAGRLQRFLGNWAGTNAGRLANMTEEQWNPKSQPTQTTQQSTNIMYNRDFATEFGDWYKNYLANLNNYKFKQGGRLISKDPIKQFKQGGHIQKYQNGLTLVRQTNDGKRIYRDSNGKIKIIIPKNSYKRENGESQFVANARNYGFTGTPEEITQKVKNWQKAIGAKEDGLFGVETMKKWEEAKGEDKKNKYLILKNGKVQAKQIPQDATKTKNSPASQNSKSSNITKQKPNNSNNNGFTKNKIITTNNDEDYAVIQNNKGFTYAIPTRYGKSGFSEGTLIGDKNNDVLYFTVPQELDEEKQLLPIIRKWRDANEGILDSIFYGSNQARRRTERDLSGLLGNGVTFRSVEVPATRRGWTNYWLQKAYLDNSGNLINPTYDY